MTVLWRIALLLTVFMLPVGLALHAADDSDTMKAPREPKAVVEGTVSFVETDGTLIVKEKSGTSQIVYLRTGSKVVRNGKEAARKDVKAGDVVRARIDSMKSALEIEVFDSCPR